MEKFTAISADTSEVLFSGQCENPGLLASDDIQIITGHAAPDGSYLSDGAWLTRSPSPSPNHDWDWALKAWVDRRTVAQAREQKRAELKLAREAAIVTPKMTSMGLFDSAPGDQDNLAKVIKLTEIAASKGYPAVARYTRGDNVRMEFTLDQLYTVALELGSVNQPIFDTYDSLRSQLEAAETIEQIEAIQWPTS